MTTSFQSAVVNPRKALLICTENLKRSPTAENLFQGWKGIWEARSAGIMPDSGGNPLTQELIDWATLVVVMEPMHSQYIRANFRCGPDKIHVLNIPDKYFRQDPELVRELRKKVPPILE